jgi:hypothetical protein
MAKSVVPGSILEALGFQIQRRTQLVTVSGSISAELGCFSQVGLVFGEIDCLVKIEAQS